MSKLKISAVVFAAMTTNAFAADLPRRAVPAAPVLPVPIFTWTGFYVGLNAGAVWGGEKVSNNAIDYASKGDGTSLITDLSAGRTNLTGTGFAGGGQLGFNVQLKPGNSLVLGGEADFGATTLKRSHRASVTLPIPLSQTPWASATLPPGASAKSYESYDAKAHEDFLGTVRGRVGFAFNNVLLYGTGGLAYGQVGYNGTFTQTDVLTTSAGTQRARVVFGAHNSKVQTGYVYGGGVEYALPADSFLNFFRSNAVTMRVEYLHYDLGNQSLVSSASTPNHSVVHYKVRDYGDSVRAGVNYKFSGL